MTTPINSLINNETSSHQNNQSMDERSSSSKYSVSQESTNTTQIAFCQTEPDVVNDLRLAKSVNSDISNQQTNAPKPKFPKNTTDILKAWLIEHTEHPYPSDEVKDVLSKKTNLNRRQIQNWFTNTRKRYIQPLRRRVDEDSNHERASEEKTTKEFTSSFKSRELTEALEKKMIDINPGNGKLLDQHAEDCKGSQKNDQNHTPIFHKEHILTQMPPRFGYLETPSIPNNNPLVFQRPTIPFGYVLVNPVMIPQSPIRMLPNSQFLPQSMVFPISLPQNTGMPTSLIPGYIPNYMYMPNATLLSKEIARQNEIRLGFNPMFAHEDAGKMYHKLDAMPTRQDGYKSGFHQPTYELEPEIFKRVKKQ